VVYCVAVVRCVEVCLAGAHGVGKSHICQAIVRAMTQRIPASYAEAMGGDRNSGARDACVGGWWVVYCVAVVRCVAVCCGVLQCEIATPGREMCAQVGGVCVQVGGVRCSLLQCGALCCSLLQCVAMCCSVLQCVAV